MYLLIAYKSSGSIYSRGCLMDSWGSNLEVHNHIKADRLKELIGKYMDRKKSGDGEYEFLIFYNGIMVYDSVNSSGPAWDGYERNLHEYNSDEYFEFEQKDDQERGQLSTKIHEIIHSAQQSSILANEEKVRLQQEKEKEAKRLHEEQEKDRRRQQFENLKKEFDNA